MLQHGVGGKSCSPHAAQPSPASCVHLWSMLTLGETACPDTGSVPQAPLRALGGYVWWWYLVSMGLTLTWVTLVASFSWKETLAWLKPFRRKLALKSLEWDGTSSTLQPKAFAAAPPHFREWPLLQEEIRNICHTDISVQTRKGQCSPSALYNPVLWFLLLCCAGEAEQAGS